MADRAVPVVDREAALGYREARDLIVANLAPGGSRVQELAERAFEEALAQSAPQSVERES